MSGSYRQELSDGFAPDWEAELREAVKRIRGVIHEVHDCIGQDGEYDNAADDGQLIGRLVAAVEIIESELPTPKEEPSDD